MITCLHPKLIFNKYLNKHMMVPCGCCDACRCLKANQWCNRLELESKGHRFAWFGTLTYCDSTYPRFDVRQLYELDSEEYDVAFRQSEDFFKLYDYNIRVHDYRDIQLFFKNLRNGIYKDYKERIPFSYYVVCEYGSTTFHPHYHMLVWFDDERLHKTIKKRVYSAWKFNNPHPSLSSFMARNRWCPVVSTAASYVAGYLNTNSELPAILKVEEFRSRHYCSKAHPLGLSGVHAETLQTLESGNPVQISYKRPTNYKMVSGQIWPSLESRLFPKVIGFSSLSSPCRCLLYRLAQILGPIRSYDEFESYFVSLWPRLHETYQTLRKTFDPEASERYYRDGVEYPCDVQRLRRAYFISLRFLKLCSKYKVSYAAYLKRIEDYYSRKEYNNLTAQLQEQVDVCQSRDGQKLLPYFLLTIDPMFYENLRNLPETTRTLYLSQFHCDGDLIDYLPINSPPYRERSYLFRKICSDNTKVKIHKDFVSRHPEFMRLYSNIYSTLKFI